MHSQFQTPNLQSDDPHQHVAAIDGALALAKAHAQALHDTEQDLTARLAVVDVRLQQERGDPRQLQDEQADLREALTQLARGVTSLDGTIPELARFMDTASPVETRAAIAELEAERSEWLPLCGDPTARATYRLRPDVGHHFSAPGVRMFAGETTELTLRQYRAFRDKFDPVVEETANAPENVLANG